LSKLADPNTLHVPSTTITLACIIVGRYSCSSIPRESSRSKAARDAYFTGFASVMSLSIMMRTLMPRDTASSSAHMVDSSVMKYGEVLVVDGQVGFAGGVGVADHWLGHARGFTRTRQSPGLQSAHDKNHHTSHRAGDLGGPHRGGSASVSRPFAG